MILWWIKKIVVCLLSGFFMLFGIQVLISAYSQDDFGVFIILFFSSNFMILISAAIFFSYIYLMIRHCRGKDAQDVEKVEETDCFEDGK